MNFVKIPKKQVKHCSRFTSKDTVCIQNTEFFTWLMYTDCLPLFNYLIDFEKDLIPINEYFWEYIEKNISLLNNVYDNPCYKLNLITKFNGRSIVKLDGKHYTITFRCNHTMCPNLLFLICVVRVDLFTMLSLSNLQFE